MVEVSWGNNKGGGWWCSKGIYWDEYEIMNSSVAGYYHVK